MIVFGNINNMPRDREFIPVNLTGMNIYIDTLKFEGLDNIDYTDPEYDKVYADILYNNDHNFVQMFEIVQLLAAGSNIFVCISDYYTCGFINEAFAKFIQQRYGYNYQMINDKDDINYYDDSSFTATGLYNYDMDKERYMAILINEGHIIQ